jgi:hypothetical protein
MKTLILSLTALASLTMASTSAFADLGDTYAQTCAKYGKPLDINKKQGTVVWRLSEASVLSEAFDGKPKQCALVRFVPIPPARYSSDQINILLNAVKLPKQTWHYSTPADINVSEWVTDDGMLYAILDKNGCLQVAFSYYMKQQGLFLGEKAVQDPFADDAAHKTNI